MNKEELLLQKRFHDLAYKADTRGILMFSDFLNLYEQDMLIRMKNKLPKIKYFASGGFSDAERKILCFCGNQSLEKESEIDFPISCLHISPLNKKFSDKLSHRDILGAVLNLGIDRSKIGDIIINDNESYLFCNSAIHDFIIDNLTRVKHTVVTTSLINRQDFIYKPNLKEITGTVSALRLDSILALALKGSRSRLQGYISGGKVFVNSKNILSNSYILKENDIVSVRGYGKFIFAGMVNQTKKGRCLVKILLYQ
ncbi:MAG: RNA-binding protein [Clostridiales bacterium]|nr:RNA-binding protein [Clostridiales bacterium]